MIKTKQQFHGYKPLFPILLSTLASLPTGRLAFLLNF